MNKILILSLLMSVCFQLHSQNIEPKQLRFYFQNGDSLLSADMDYFKQKNFILGWAWGFGW